jgi:predicted  nucleic acid-binding Zn-ribbon protein
MAKLTKEELQEFKEINTAYQQAIFDLGILSVAFNETEQKLNDLKGEKIDLVNHIKTVTERQQELSVKLGEKYGDKQVDLETGELK